MSEGLSGADVFDLAFASSRKLLAATNLYPYPLQMSTSDSLLFLQPS